MKRNSMNFPVILRDGGWRELRRAKGVYWPVYRRRKLGERQEVRLIVDHWVLFRDGKPQGASDSLDDALMAAEVAT